MNIEGTPAAGFGGPGAPERQRPPRPSQLSWLHPSDLVNLSFMNALLKVITLGIYQFWGKTEVRKRVWSAVRIEGEPLEYTGTGKELFMGFLFVFGAVLLPLLLLPLALQLALGTRGQVLGQFAFFGIYIYLFGVGVYRAQRYRLTRTRWRGIRGTLDGSPWRYGWTSLWTALLIPLTLGWIYPWRAARLQRLVVENMRFGDRPFTFVENAGPLYTRFIAVWLGGLLGLSVLGGGTGYIYSQHMLQLRGKLGKAGELSPTGVGLMLALLIGLYLFAILITTWYRAGQFNNFAEATSFEGVKFNGTMSGLGLLWVTISNFVLLIVTLGIAAPVVQARAARYFVQHLQFDGEVPFDAIAQGAADGATQGEGLAQAFDFDAF
jgi:uncharacterized membrane protein YjgN (DUF898 family)